MFKVIVVAAFVAAPLLVSSAFAKDKAAPAAEEHTGPVPYSELAAIDAKINAPMKTRARKHVHHKAAASTSTVAPPAAAPAR